MEKLNREELNLLIDACQQTYRYNEMLSLCRLLFTHFDSFTNEEKGCFQFSARMTKAQYQSTLRTLDGIIYMCKISQEKKHLQILLNKRQEISDEFNKQALDLIKYYDELYKKVNHFDDRLLCLKGALHTYENLHSCGIVYQKEMEAAAEKMKKEIQTEFQNENKRFNPNLIMGIQIVGFHYYNFMDRKAEAKEILKSPLEYYSSVFESFDDETKESISTPIDLIRDLYMQIQSEDDDENMNEALIQSKGPE